MYATVLPRSQHHLPDTVKAKKKELDTIKEFRSYEEIREAQKVNIISYCWVIVKKQFMGEEVTKARLVARGDML